MILLIQKSEHTQLVFIHTDAQIQNATESEQLQQSTQYKYIECPYLVRQFCTTGISMKVRKQGALGTYSQASLWLHCINMQPH